MSPSDPQFIYMILVLPSLFGLTLLGDGVNKMLHDKQGGYISFAFGLIFLAVVGLSYLFFSTNLIN